MSQFIIQCLDEKLRFGNYLYWKYKKRQASLGVKQYSRSALAIKNSEKRPRRRIPFSSKMEAELKARKFLKKETVPQAFPKTLNGNYTTSLLNGYLFETTQVPQTLHRRHMIWIMMKLHDISLFRVTSIRGVFRTKLNIHDRALPGKQPTAFGH